MDGAPIAAPAAPSAPAQTDAPAAPAEAKADAPKGETAAQAEARKLKLKVDGADLELPEDEVIRRASKSSAADKRFEEAAKLRKEVADEKAMIGRLLQEVQKNPRAFLSDPRVNVDVKEFARAVLAEEIQKQMAAEEEATLSPTEKRARELERELEGYRKRDVDAKAAKDKEELSAKEKAHQAEVDKHRDTLGDRIVKVLESSGLPKDPETALEVVNILTACVEQGKPAEVEDVVDYLKARESARALRLSPKELRAKLSADALKAFRELDVEEFKKANPLTSSESVVGRRDAKPGQADAPRVRRETELRKELANTDWGKVLAAASRDGKGRFK